MYSDTCPNFNVVLLVHGVSVIVPSQGGIRNLVLEPMQVLACILLARVIVFHPVLTLA